MNNQAQIIRDFLVMLECMRDYEPNKDRKLWLHRLIGNIRKLQSELSS